MSQVDLPVKGTACDLPVTDLPVSLQWLTVSGDLSQGQT